MKWQPAKPPLLPLCFLVYAFNLVACQQNNGTTTTPQAESEVTVGWTAGPTRRSTLTLIWGCLSTIFASTWTVLHLNVPGPHEPWWETLGRKIKWMFITVLFPEFIFTKAVCELRQAVADLHYMSVAMKKNPLKWKDTVPASQGPTGSQVHITVSWEVEFNCRVRWLYKLFRLPALPPANDDEEKQGSPHSPLDDEDNRGPAGLSDLITDTDGAPDVVGDGSGDHVPSASGSDAKRLSSNDAPARAREQPGGDPHTGSENPEHAGEGISKDPEHADHAMAAKKASDALGSVLFGEQELQPLPSFGAPRSHSRLRKSKSTARPLDMHTPSPEKRYWTLSHSIYANMGGLVYCHADDDLRKLSPLTSHNLAYNIECLSNTDELKSLGLDPKEFKNKLMGKLKDLVLDEKDINDKSKADWVLRAIVVLQIGWLVLNDCARAATGLPVTQIEVATGAFAVIAVATFVINWWKPKDVLRSTILSFLPVFFISDYQYRYQSFARRILQPSNAADVPLSFQLNRISNDTIWMGGKPPLALVLMALSSMVFGGLHGLAWNSEFPSKAETVLWRTAVVVAATLPGVTLAITFFIEHMATNFAENRFSAAVVKLLADLDKVPHQYWAQFDRLPACLSWPLGSQFVFYQKLSQVSRNVDINWEEIPTPPENLPPEAKETVEEDGRWFSRAQKAMNELATAWVLNKSHHDKKSACEEVQFDVFHHWIRNPVLFGQQWNQYEAYLRSTISSLKPELREFCVRDFVVSKIQDVHSLKEKKWDFEKKCNRVSQYLAIVSSIIYATARIATLVLLFLSLRSVPDSVYEDVQWTRFLPKIS